MDEKNLSLIASAMSSEVDSWSWFEKERILVCDC